MPTPGTPVRGTQAPANANMITTVLSIKHFPIIKSNITWTKELNDTNCKLECLEKQYEVRDLQGLAVLHGFTVQVVAAMALGHDIAA